MTKQMIAKEIQLSLVAAARGAMHWMTAGSRKADSTFPPSERLGAAQEAELVDKLKRFLVANSPSYYRNHIGSALEKYRADLILSESEFRFVYLAMIWCRDISKMGDWMETYTGASEEEIDAAIEVFGNVFDEKPVI